MNQIYPKPRYLFLLLGLLTCSAGMAQSPLPKNKTANAQTTLGSPNANQKNDQVLKKTADPSINQEDNDNPFLTQKSVNGITLSQEESDAINKRMKESQKLLSTNQSAATAKTIQVTSDSTKVRSFAKSSNLTLRNVFEVRKEDFELSNADKMQLKSVSEKHGRKLATYQQLHNSVPVEGAIYKVRENKTKIDAFGETSKKLPTNSNYKVSASQGLENALREVNAKEYVWQSKKLSPLVHKKISTKPQGELVYVGPNFSSELKEYHLAWKYDVFATNPQSSQTIYVDANTGKIILKIDLSRDLHSSSSSSSPAADGRAAIGKGKARFAGDVTFGTTHYADGYRLETLEGKYKVPIYTLNMNHAEHASDEVLTEYIDEDNNWNDLYNQDHDEVAIDIHWGLQKTLNYYEEKFDRNSVDNEGMTIFGLAHLGKNVQNASWTGGWAQFGDGNNQPFVSLGITGHEMTHAVTQFSAGLIYQGESGAMNESFSDIFGISIELYAGKDSKNDIWMLGDELYKHGSLRNMSNPKAEGQPDTYGGEFWTNPAIIQNDNGGVHQNSGITNYWYYLLVEGGDGVNDLNNSYSVKPIGLEKAEKIAYVTLTEYLSPSSNFMAMRQASLLATEDLYGLGSEEYKQVTNAWYAIGVGPAYGDKQVLLVSYENPSVSCGPLKGEEPFYVKIRNTGSTVFKADENLSFKLRAMASALGRMITFYTYDGTVPFAKDLNPGEETTLALKSKIPYQIAATNYVEVKIDTNPIVEFGAKEGYSFVTQIYVPVAQKDYDLKVTGLKMPDYTGGVLTSSHQPEITIFNLGCQDISAGTVLKVGYANTLPGSTTVWKDVTLTADFKGNSEMTIPFDTTIDLSADGLHTYEGYVTYDKDPVATNNSVLNASYTGIISQFPYVQGFERTPGGWNTKSLNTTNQKFVFQNYPLSFRNTKSQYIWGDLDLRSNDKVALNSDFVLQSPIFDFTNIVSPYVEFDLYYLFHKGYDGLIVEYSEDKGQNWKKVENVNYPEVLHYNDAFEGGWFTGINTNLKKDPYQIRLDDFKGKKVAFRFRIKTDDYNDGFLGGFVDNIFVGEAPYDLEVLSSKFDAGKCTVDNTNGTIITKITNNFPTNTERVTITTKILNPAKTEVFSKTDVTTLTFTKFKDTISFSTPNINLKDIGENTISVSVFPEDMAKDLKQGNNALVFTYDNWANADEKVSVLPYKMDFEDDSKYKGWRTYENKGATGWKHGEWGDLRSPAWVLSEHTKFMASNDDKCNCDSSNDMLVSPIFDLTNYKQAHLSFDGYGDNLHLSDGYVKVSTDGGETWKEVFHMPYYGNWWEYGVDLTEYAGKSCVMVAFVHNDNGLFASGFAVDNIELKETKTNLRTSNLVVAETVYKDAPSHEFNINVKNSAYNTLNKFTIEYQISQNGTAVGDPITLEKSEEILVGETITYKINGLPQLASGKYDIAVKAYTADEPKDQAQVIKASFEVVANAQELGLEAFSNIPAGSLFGQKGFVSSQSDDNYPWSVVVSPDNTYLTIPKKDHTGDTAKTMLYNQLEGLSYYGELISPMYKLSEKASAVEFYYAMQSNANDIFLVDIKVAGGEWTELWRRSKEGMYEDTDWKRASLNISKYKGKSVMFRFRHAKAAGYSYMVLDDLKVFNEEITDVAMEILSPKDVCGSQEYKVRLINEGQVAIKENAVQVEMQYLNTSETILETVEAGIPVGQSIEYTFKKQPKLDNMGDSHVFNFTAKLEGDIVDQNNIIENYYYQGVSGDFKLFDSASIHGYAGKSVYINAQTNLLIRKLDAVSYKWNTGEITRDLVITKPGDYIVTAVLENGCTLTEKVTVTFDTFESELQSGALCGPEVVLNPGHYAAYEWFDGSTDPTYTTTESGDYYVTVYNENGLGKIFTTSVTVLENKTPEIQAAGDKKIEAVTEAPSYQWYLNGRIIPNATQKTIVAIWEGTYSLETTNSNGCNSMSEPIDSKGLIIGKLTNPFRVFPNPAVDNVNVFLAEKADGEAQMKIYAMNGNAVWSKTYSAVPSTINVSQLTTGVYILDCTVQGKKYTAKIIKK